MRPPVLIENARKDSVAVQRIRIGREDAELIREAERIGGQQAGLRILLEILFKPGSHARK